MVDVLGEMATRAIKGDSEYIMTYYRKSREERAEDYRKVTPKLTVFTQTKDVRDNVEDEIRDMSKDELIGLLELLRNGKNQSEQSSKTNKLSL